MITDELSQIFLDSFTKSDFSFELVVFNFMASFILSCAIAWMYTRTHRGVSYSQSFIFTLIFVSVIATIAIMVIGNSITRAFALLGTFSIVRFRTAMKDSKDTSYIFLSLIIGIAVGTGNYQIALISTVLIMLLIQVVHTFNFGAMRNHEYLLSFTLDTQRGNDTDYKNLFGMFLKKKLLLDIHAVETGMKLEITYNIDFKKESKITEFLNKMSSIAGVSDVGLVSTKRDIEL